MIIVNGNSRMIQLLAFTETNFNLTFFLHYFKYRIFFFIFMPICVYMYMYIDICIDMG